jgi:hypothetical protein
MSSTPYIKKVAIVGASGNIGSSITKALLASPSSPSITAITRPESTATFPPGISVAQASYSDHSALVAAFKGHQALVISLGFAVPLDSQNALIDAAGEAGIEYILPCEFGSDTDDAALGQAVPMLPAKKAVRDYIAKVGKSKWIGFVNNPWTDYSLTAGMFGIDIPSKRATLYTSSGKEVAFNTTSLAQAGRGIAGLLTLSGEKLARHANKLVYVNSFFVTPRELLDAVQAATGTKDDDWEIETKDVQERIKEGGEKLSKGDHMGMVDLLYGATMVEGLGNRYKEGTLNEELALPEESLVDICREVVTALGL